MSADLSLADELICPGAGDPRVCEDKLDIEKVLEVSSLKLDTSIPELYAWFVSMNASVPLRCIKDHVKMDDSSDVTLYSSAQRQVKKASQISAHVKVQMSRNLACFLN